MYRQIIFSLLFLTSFLCASLGAMEQGDPMDIDQGAGAQQTLQPGQPGGPEEMAFPQETIQPHIVDQIARNWMQRPNYWQNLTASLIQEYGGTAGLHVARRIREIITTTSIILVNNTQRGATVTINIQVTGAEPIQVMLSPLERSIVELPQNLWPGLVQGMRMDINASLDVAPQERPRSFRRRVTVTGGGRIIISPQDLTVRNIIQPTMPQLQRARRNLFGPTDL